MAQNGTRDTVVRVIVTGILGLSAWTLYNTHTVGLQQGVMAAQMQALNDKIQEIKEYTQRDLARIELDVQKLWSLRRDED